MSWTEKGKQTQDTTEDDYEAFVRESLANLSKGQEKIIQDFSNLKDKVHLNEAALAKISEQFTILGEKVEVLKGELHDASCKVDEIDGSVQNHAKQIEEMYERLQSFERYSRESW